MNINKIEPLVSVIVPCYNHEKFVQQTIESIINQSYKNIELIVIDDGSTDNSPQILKELSKKYNFYYIHQKNIGLPATLNKMIKIAKGKYISIIASDDILTPDKIYILVHEFLKLSNKYAMVCGNAKFIDDNGDEFCFGKDIKTDCTFLDYFTKTRNDFNFKNSFGEYQTLLKKNYIPAMSTLVLKEKLIEVGLFEENIPLEDWNMWLKLTQKYKIKYVDEIVAYYRWHETNSIKTMITELQLIKYTILEREKEYCYSVGLINEWKQSYYGTILDLLLTNKYMTFIQTIKHINIFGFILFILEKFIFRIIKK